MKIKSYVKRKGNLNFISSRTEKVEQRSYGLTSSVVQECDRKLMKSYTVIKFKGLNGKLIDSMSETE